MKSQYRPTVGCDPQVQEVLRVVGGGVVHETPQRSNEGTDISFIHLVSNTWTNWTTWLWDSLFKELLNRNYKIQHMSTLLWQLNLFGMWSNTNVCIILTQGLEIINNEQFKVGYK